MVEGNQGKRQQYIEAGRKAAGEARERIFIENLAAQEQVNDYARPHKGEKLAPGWNRPARPRGQATAQVSSTPPISPRSPPEEILSTRCRPCSTRRKKALPRPDHEPGRQHAAPLRPRPRASTRPPSVPSEILQEDRQRHQLPQAPQRSLEHGCGRRPGGCGRQRGTGKARVLGRDHRIMLCRTARNGSPPNSAARPATARPGRRGRDRAGIGRRSRNAAGGPAIAARRCGCRDPPLERVGGKDRGRRRRRTRIVSGEH